MARIHTHAHTRTHWECGESLARLGEPGAGGDANPKDSGANKSSRPPRRRNELTFNIYALEMHVR